MHPGEARVFLLLLLFVWICLGTMLVGQLHTLSHNKLYNFLFCFVLKQFPLTWEERTDSLAIAQNEFLS